MVQHLSPQRILDMVRQADCITPPTTGMQAYLFLCQRYQNMAGHLNPASPDTPGLTSSRGRLVKPKVWEDGTEAVPAVGTACTFIRCPLQAFFSQMLC